MLGKRSRSVIGRLSELLIPGSRAGLLDGSPSPTSPLDLFHWTQLEKIHNRSNSDIKKTNNNIKNFNLVPGVGLGIVAALEKSTSSSSGGGGGGKGFRAKYFICSPGGSGRSWSEELDDYSSAEEDYTYVTFHGPKESFTMVYHDQSENEKSEGGGGGGDGGQDGFQGLEFLSSCQLCGKKLHGQDIYMYRGEKGFCSTECRSAQIIMDERSEQCRLEAAPRAVDVWSYTPGYSEGQIFSTSILAA